MMLYPVLIFCFITAFRFGRAFPSQLKKLPSPHPAFPAPLSPPTPIKAAPNVPLPPTKFISTSYQRPAKVSSVVVAWLLLAGRAQAMDLDKGAALFQRNCALCHAGGATVFVSSGTKTLNKLDLELNNYATKEDIVTLLAKGKGLMPPYLGASDQDMLDVAEFVLEKATQGTW